MRIFLTSLVLLAGCYRVPDKIEPQLSYAVEERYLQKLPEPFSPLSSEEKSHEWGKEYLIGVSFAKQLDLYRAITAFKRSQILIPDDHPERRLELSYNILLAYYLGKRYDDLIDTFMQSPLRDAGPSFPAYHDLLIILYESYDQVGETEKAEQVLNLLKTSYPETASLLHEGNVMAHGDIDELKKLDDKDYLQEIVHCFELNKKSVQKAQTLNAFFPGAGYLYVGQKQSAVTALLLNSAFIAAAVLFFQHGNIPAGIITTSFEAGWYFGGIYGAGEAAKLYNERLYERIAIYTMERENLFPVLSLRYSF